MNLLLDWKGVISFELLLLLENDLLDIVDL